MRWQHAAIAAGCMKRKIYLIQPTYRASDGRLLQGKSVFVHSCAIPALAASLPADWEREVCLEFFENVNYETDASVVGISSMGYDILHGYEIADEFRRRGKVVIFGGYQAHFNRHRLHAVADSIVYGHPGPRQMARILGDVEACALAPEYDVGINMDFPFDYSALVGRRIAFMPVLTSVGCRHRCDFCCTAARYNGRYRLRKLAHVLADLRALRRHTRRFGLVDSNVCNSRGYLLALCAAVVREQLDIVWGAEATIDIGKDEEILRALRRAGCRILFIGLETPNQRSLDSVHKPHQAQTCDRAMANIRRHGIAVAGYFLVGLDGDTAETFDEMFDFIHRIRVNVPIINILLPAPGTRVFERLDQEGRLLVRGEDDYLRNALSYGISCSHCFYRPALLTVDQVEEGFIQLRRRLGSLRETVWRSMVPNPRVAASLLLMNAEFRRESKRIVRARAETNGSRPGGGSGPSPEPGSQPTGYSSGGRYAAHALPAEKEGMR
jgi:radical SAM superfamily enzyme YgiQ (UPF0313 family)